MVMDGMEKFFKITSYISINSTFDNDDDDYIHKHGEGGSGGELKISTKFLIHI